MNKYNIKKNKSDGKYIVFINDKLDSLFADAISAQRYVRLQKYMDLNPNKNILEQNFTQSKKVEVVKTIEKEPEEKKVEVVKIIEKEPEEKKVSAKSEDTVSKTGPKAELFPYTMPTPIQQFFPFPFPNFHFDSCHAAHFYGNNHNTHCDHDLNNNCGHFNKNQNLEYSNCCHHENNSENNFKKHINNNNYYLNRKDNTKQNVFKNENNQDLFSIERTEIGENTEFYNNVKQYVDNVVQDVEERQELTQEENRQDKNINENYKKAIKTELEHSSEILKQIEGKTNEDFHEKLKRVHEEKPRNKTTNPFIIKAEKEDTFLKKPPTLNNKRIVPKSSGIDKYVKTLDNPTIEENNQFHKQIDYPKTEVFFDSDVKDADTELKGFELKRFKKNQLKLKKKELKRIKKNLSNKKNTKVSLATPLENLPAING
ncbi:hypothetical protein [Spiroplasma endosymbiont of Amphibalanus improvisus]|uniref:hypothetical protein n=1 Tax=Spiroplasma endosymbiont of Amphibalanus improvisus TaxID=3066327 RepID=UPI00313F2EEE